MFSNGKPRASARAVLHGVPQGTTMVALGLAVTAALRGQRMGSGPSVLAAVLGWLERWQGALARWPALRSPSGRVSCAATAAFLGGIAPRHGVAYLHGLATPLVSGTF